MADQKELAELQQRIALLRWDDQLYLFELVLADHRRKRDELRSEMQTQNLAAIQELLAMEQKQTSNTGAKRAAG